MTQTATDAATAAIAATAATPPASPEVLIVGAGPAGLLLACELRLARVDAVVIERHPWRPDFCRGFNLNARALDLLARRDFGDSAAGWTDRIEILSAKCPDHPGLRAMLLRPDGHIGWLRADGHDDPHCLHAALRRWFGPAVVASG